ncbi:Predicted pyrophosphatase or phosphodiesterase, AlkP superfamily [Ruminococcaceae bacterium YRB3002]|nr:Predicted pyrophosphatase or phosphodiesterase, AlkP superfamily [Ruminococcaceae bacterium YRB3002]
MYEVVYNPDYKNCIANLPNSVLKYFGAETVGDTLPLMDKYLDREYKNVVVMLLDGMGSSVLVWNMDHGDHFYRHYAGSYDSVFPSSTVPATISAMTGLQPCEHAWLGWDNYYRDIDKTVTVFTNTVQDTGRPAADFDVPRRFTPYRTVTERLNEAGIKAYDVSPYSDPFPGTFPGIMDLIKKHCDEPGRKYIYAYWPSPDDILHEHGGGESSVKEIKEYLEDITAQITAFTGEMKDTLFVVTADHSHTDVSISRLEEYPQITGCLERLPSLEPRVLSFFVKKGRKREFVREFRKIYGEKFMLLTKKEVLERKLFGTGKEHEKFRDMLGDYIAVATSDQSVMFTKEQPWVSMHGGLTEREIKIPLIVFRDFFILGTDIDAYLEEALRRLRKKYFWAAKELFDTHYTYRIEETDGKKEFVYIYTWDDGTSKRYAEGWDGEMFIEQIVNDQNWAIERANEVREVLDVRPDYGVDCHGWCLERFEFRSHVLGGYSAFVQAGDRCAGGSREFFFDEDQMSGTFEEFLQKNGELLSGAFGLTSDYMRSFKGLKEFLGFKE